MLMSNWQTTFYYMALSVLVKRQLKSKRVKRFEQEQSSKDDFFLSFLFSNSDYPFVVFFMVVANERGIDSWAMNALDN